jgi:hypothetical protein
VIAGVHELLAGNPRLVAFGVSSQRIIELQSVDERPFNDGVFIVANFEEQSLIPTLNRGPRVVTLWVHSCDDRSRDYRPIGRILSVVDQIFADVEHYTGSDGVRITGFRRQGRSGNLRDPGWNTIARNATFDVLYDESAV